MTDLATLAARGRRLLEEAGSSPDTAQRDAALLARWILKWDAAAWIANNRETPPADFPDQFFALIARRARHEPVAYLTGEREFYGRVFKVTTDVLIPRPETEFIVEESLAVLNTHGERSRKAPTIVDVGTGSGCLAVTLALEREDARVVATDISAEALDVARANARRLDVASRVEFRGGPFLAGFDGPVDLLVSNPPYVPTTDRPSLAADVVDFEPPIALFAGVDGLDVIRALLPLAAEALAPGGALVMEIGYGQLDAVRALATHANGLALTRVKADLQSIPRVVTLTRAK